MTTPKHHPGSWPLAACLLGGLLALVGCGPSVTVLEPTGEDCDPGLTDCAGSCVDLTSDPQNCGACATVCDPSSVCSAGACKAECDGWLTPCGQSCVDVETDPNHCGGCGIQCASGEVCLGGNCQSGGCPTGLTQCGSQCVDLGSHAQHCGGCFQGCGTGETCLGGECVGDDCPPGLMLCGEACIDPMNDSAHCGGCDQPCGPGLVCAGGACNPDCGPLLNCGGLCVDPQFDPNHCGGCYQPCGPGESCNAGSCTCSNPVCGLCGIEDIGSVVPQTKTGMGDKNVKEPTCAAPGSPEQVYSFTAPATGGYQFSTAGSSYDTALYLLDQGCAEIACNDDTSYDLSSQVNVELTAGQQVLVVVDGFGGDFGNFVLNITSAPTPVCPMHTLASASPQSVSGSTLGQPSTEAGMCGGWGGPEVSYSFTAPASGGYVFHTAGSQFDTVLYLRDGSCTGPEIACNDDQIELNSLVYVTLTQGQTVMVFVDSYDTFGGPYNLSVVGPI